MALTTIKTGALADDAVTEDKIANAINTARAANTAKDLTALSASNLTSGTVPDARFPATLPAASAANLTAVPAANITGTLPAISAANLTSIPAANITGTLPAISGANLTNLPGGGKVVQVAQTLNTSDYSTTGSSYVQGPETATFTLTDSSNKVLVLCNWMAYMDARSGSTVNIANALYRGSVASGSQISLGGQPMIYFGNTLNYEAYMGHCFLQYLDTPGGNTTYSLAVKNVTGGNSAMIRGTQQTTTIPLMEIDV